MTTLYKSTTATKASQIQRSWHVIDAKGKVLGRVATEIASLLQGKNKTYYVPNLDCGDYVVVINAKDVVVTGKKNSKKLYDTYSGYPGGRKTISFNELIQKDPEKVFRFALRGMLPKNKLRDQRLSRLYVFAGEEHPFTDKF